MLFTTQDSQTRKYEILRVVNRGGMGEIAMARVKGTKGFEKLVVLKRLRADAEREDHIAMFDVEQEVMSKIEHPNIVKVFDQPYVDDIPYLAMEYVRGRNLDQMVRAAHQQKKEISYPIALTLVAEVLRGLAFVHRLKDTDGNALGVVHQDMTPSNVMLSFFGEVKITDFGISYVTSRDGGLRKGVLKGKPRYVAPEVLAGKRVNNRADIYGVGVVLYELLKGKALFARTSVKETLAAVARNELPDFADEFPEHGPALLEILQRSLAKDPNERYRTAEEMAAAVLNELARNGGPVPPANLGYFLRGLFANDPDVPEMDPEMEKAIREGSLTAEQAALKPKGLDDTLKALDRLLAPSGSSSTSVDMFELPDDLAGELSELSDNDPFAALTPIPDFVWEAKSEAEILSKAEELYSKEPEPSLFSSGPTSSSAVLPDESLADTMAREPRSSGPTTDGGYSMVRKEEHRAAVETPAFTERPTVPMHASREETEAPPSRFWMGLMLGAVFGAAAGAAIMAVIAG